MVLAVGCGGPIGVEPLTDNDVNNMIEIAVKHPEVLELLEENEEYTTQTSWYVIAWEESKAVGWYRMDYEDIADGTPPDAIAYVTEDVTINPELTLIVGKPTRLFISVFFSTNKKEVLDVQPFPAKSGPVTE